MSRPIAVLDCETDPFRIGRVPKPFAWGWFDGRAYRQWPSRYVHCTCDLSKADVRMSPLHLGRCPVRKVCRDFFRFLREQQYIVYAHNGGKFDWHFMLGELAPYEELMLINGRLARFHIGMAECRDSYSILPVPLAAYKKTEIDYDKLERPRRRENWEEISLYLRDDCIYLHELITAFVDRYGVQLTQAAAAMNQWKKVTKEYSLPSVPSSGRDFYERFSPYYYGGRVQCFESGIIDTEFSVYDINSAYPYAMLQEHPYGTEFVHAEGFVRGADFYRVRGVSRGAWPYRGGSGGSAAFPGLDFPADGEVREFTITAWEYAATMGGRNIGDVSKSLPAGEVLESYTFPEKISFRAYIEKFYTMRMQSKAAGDDAGSLFAKLLMNSLYGKFAANPANYKNYMAVPMGVIAGLPEAGWDFAGELGPWALASAPLADFQERYYNIATGASITGFVRAMLWRAIKSSKGVLYCDTDSLAVRDKGASVVLGDALGQWKHEGSFDRAGIAGKKLYIFRSVPDGKGRRSYKVASKGSRLSNAQLWAVARGDEVDYSPQVPTFSPNKAPVFTERRIKFTA